MHIYVGYVYDEDETFIAYSDAIALSDLDNRPILGISVFNLYYLNADLSEDEAVNEQ